MSPMLTICHAEQSKMCGGREDEEVISVIFLSKSFHQSTLLQREANNPSVFGELHHVLQQAVAFGDGHFIQAQMTT